MGPAPHRLRANPLPCEGTPGTPAGPQGARRQPAAVVPAQQHGPLTISSPSTSRHGVPSSTSHTTGRPSPTSTVRSVVPTSPGSPGGRCRHPRAELGEGLGVAEQGGAPPKPCAVAGPAVDRQVVAALDQLEDRADWPETNPAAPRGAGSGGSGAGRSASAAAIGARTAGRSSGTTTWTSRLRAPGPRTAPSRTRCGVTATARRPWRWPARPRSVDHDRWTPGPARAPSLPANGKPAPPRPRRWLARRGALERWQRTGRPAGRDGPSSDGPCSRPASRRGPGTTSTSSRSTSTAGWHRRVHRTWIAGRLTVDGMWAHQQAPDGGDGDA